MADVHSVETRSYNMSRIRSKDTKPELILRKFLFNNGFRFRLHDKKLPGTPDVVLKKYRTVIFIHGCFWHGHKDCKYFVVPKTRTDWWFKKISNNQINDIIKKDALSQNNWNIIEIFECELKKEKLKQTMMKVINNIKRQTTW